MEWKNLNGASNEYLNKKTFPAAPGLEIGSPGEGEFTRHLCIALHEAGDHPATALFPVTVTFKELKPLANPLNLSGMPCAIALCTGS